MTAPFVHLHLHSEFSLVVGIVRIDDLIALTDLSNVFGMVKFYRAAVAAGIKPVVGADVWLENPADRNKPYRLVLLCQDRTGYRHLSRLLTRAYADGQHAGRPCLSRDWLSPGVEGLIVLSGAQDGDIAQALLSGNGALAESLAREYLQWFPRRFYLELQRTGQPLQEEYNHAAVALAGRLGLPVVATNHVHFLKPEEFEAVAAYLAAKESRFHNGDVLRVDGGYAIF